MYLGSQFQRFTTLREKMLSKLSESRLHWTVMHIQQTLRLLHHVTV